MRWRLPLVRFPDFKSRLGNLTRDSLAGNLKRNNCLNFSQLCCLLDCSICFAINPTLYIITLYPAADNLREADPLKLSGQLPTFCGFLLVKGVQIAPFC